MKKTVDSSYSNAINYYKSLYGTPTLLTEKEEYGLAVKIANGSKEAMDELVAHNIPLAVKCLNEKVHITLSEELLQSALIGLVEAASKYSPEKGRFGKYAVSYINSAISTELRCVSSQVYSMSRVCYYSKALKMKNFQTDFYKKNNRFPSKEETMSELNFNEKDYNDYTEYLRSKTVDTVSLDEPINNDSNSVSYSDNSNNMKLSDCISTADDDYEKVDMRITLEHYINKLPNDYKTVLILSCGLFDNKQMSIQDVADYLGVNKDKINHMKANAIKELKEIVVKENEEEKAKGKEQDSKIIYKSARSQNQNRNQDIAI